MTKGTLAVDKVFLQIVRWITLASVLMLFALPISYHSFGKEIVPPDTVVNAIEQSQLPQNVLTALKNVVAKNPKGMDRRDEKCWACESGDFVGVATAVRYTERTKLTSVSSAQAHAFAEVVLFVIKKGIYEKGRFIDAELLKAALLNKEGTLRYTGNVKGMLHQTFTVDGWAVTVGYCPLKLITAELLKPANIATLSTDYSEAGRQRILQATKNEDWQTADKTWRHLKEQKMLSPQLVIDYGKCLVEQEHTERAIKHFAEYLDGYRDIRDKMFFSQIGEILEPLAEHNKDAERIALKALDEAERLMLRKEKTIELPTTPPPFLERNLL